MKRSRIRRALVVVAILMVALGVAGVLVVEHSRTAGYRNVLSHQVNRYLKQHLGSEASVEHVAVGWSSIAFTNLRLPLDHHGSFLIVPHAEAGIRPLDVITSPSEFTRALRTLKLHGAHLLIAARQLGDASDKRKPVLSFHVPAVLYTVLARFDSLNALEIDGGLISYRATDRERAIAHDLNLSVKRTEAGSFSVSGSGKYLTADEANFTISGELSSQTQSFALACFAEVPPGSAAFLSDDLRLVRTGGGTVSVSITALDSVGAIEITSALNDVYVRSGNEDIHIPRLRVTSHGDSLVLDSATVETSQGLAGLGGYLILGSNQLYLSGTAVAWFTDTVNVDFHICGSLTQPTGTFTAPVARVSGQEFRDVSGEVSYAGGMLNVTSLEFDHVYGHGECQGSLKLDSTLSWIGAGRFALDSSFATKSWRPRFGIVEWDATGDRHTISPRINLIAPGGARLAEVTLHQDESEWIADITDSSGGVSTARVTPLNDRVRATVDNGHVMLRALFETPTNTLDPFTALSVTFEGSVDSGEIAIRSSLAEDSLVLLTRILRQFDFFGHYERRAETGIKFVGEWSGLNSRGEPFQGSADVDVLDQVMSVNRIFVDEAGVGRGAIDFAHRTVDIEFEIANVAFDRLPLVPDFARRARIMGITSGYFNAHGDLNLPEWTARLSVAEGAVLGVPGYWINLDAAGIGSHIELKHFDVGRDIQKILAAEGWFDVKQNQIAITAETGSARAEDFLLALTGSSGLLSGSLDGSAAISGQLTRPDVESKWLVTNGLVLNEIHFSTLNMSVQMTVSEQGAPMVRISELEMGEWGKYFFTAHVESGVSPGSPLQGHLEGGGDLLYLVDQLDRSFHSSGSSGNMALDVGGTLGHPILLGGTLTLNHGRFTYPPASPIPLDMQIAVHVGDSGAVETGTISMRNSDQYLKVTAGAGMVAAYSSLRPIVLSSIGANLGVLELRTGAHGMPIRLPGLMKPEWAGQIMSGAALLNPVTLSLRNDSTLLIDGDIELQNSRVTFPFVGGGRGPMRPVTQWLVDRLEEARWNLDVHVGSGNHYDVEITGLRNSSLFGGLRDSPILSTLADYLDHLSIDAVVEPTDAPLQIRETLADTSFYVKGRLSSSHGRVEYLDQDFRIDYAYCDFDETSIMPVLEGRASTYGVDSLGRRVPVYLTMYVIDRETQVRQRRGRLDDLTFVLEDDAGNPPEDVLALLGYGLGTVSGKAQQVVTTSVVRAVGRHWLDPIERRLERWTPFDEITITPVGGRTTSLARVQKQRAVSNDSLQSNGAVRFFTGSQLTVGKYLTNDVFVTYTGELSENETAPQSGRLSLVHLWNLEYRIKPLSPDLVLDFGVEYDEIERRRDESVSLKYSFSLEP